MEREPKDSASEQGFEQVGVILERNIKNGIYPQIICQ